MTILRDYKLVRDRVYGDIAKVVIGGLEAENCRQSFLENGGLNYLILMHLYFIY